MSGCGAVMRWCGQQLGLIEQEIGREEISDRLKIEAEQSDEENRKRFRELFIEQVPKVSRLVEASLAQSKREGIFAGKAVILGCQNHGAALHLLKNGWEVIAVEVSRKALENLQGAASKIEQSQVTLVCQEIETYQFPSQVDMISVEESLQFCDPLAVQDVWNRAYQALKKGGRIVGAPYDRSSNSVIEKLHRTTFGGWFANKPLIEALLADKGYQQEVCEYNKYWFQSDLRRIEFVGRKITE